MGGEGGPGPVRQTGEAVVVVGAEPAVVDGQLAADDKLLQEGSSIRLRGGGRPDGGRDLLGRDLAEVEVGGKVAGGLGDRVVPILRIVGEAFAQENLQTPPGLPVAALEGRHGSDGPVHRKSCQQGMGIGDIGVREEADSRILH